MYIQTPILQFHQFANPASLFCEFSNPAFFFRQFASLHLPTPSISETPTFLPSMASHIDEAISCTMKRKRRTPEELAEDNAKRDAKRIIREKERKEKEEDKRRKRAEKVVRMELAQRAKLEKVPRFTWTTAATEELLQLVAHLKNEHDAVLEVNPGFISWAKFFKENAARKEAFETLKEVSFDAIDRRYKAICTTYKAVRDVCAETGGGGMLDQLAKYNMSQSVYDTIWELHKDNDAMNAVGGADISDMNNLFNAPQSPYMSDSVGLFELSGSDSDVPDLTPLSQPRMQRIQKPLTVNKKFARKKGKVKEIGVDEGLTALIRMQVESQERMERLSVKLEAQREKGREDREARRAEQEARLEKEREEERKNRAKQEARLEKEREEERKDRAQERKNAQMMNVMVMTMLAKMSGMDMSQLNSQAK